MGIQVYFKGGNTMKNIPMAHNDKENITQKSGGIYEYKCDGVECDDEYFGECMRTFGGQTQRIS